jgi:hypothetical protein
VIQLAEVAPVLVTDVRMEAVAALCPVVVAMAEYSEQLDRERLAAAKARLPRPGARPGKAGQGGADRGPPLPAR